MSHSSSHAQVGAQVAGKPPTIRVAIMGIGLIAVGYLGFYSYLNRRHERKLLTDEHTNKVSAWESRIIQQSKPSSESANLRASRVQLRASPMVAPITEHNTGHRSVSSDRASGILSDDPRVSQQPTAQRDGKNGFVYTKRVGMDGEGVGERKKAGLKAEVAAKVDEVKDEVRDAAKGVKEGVVGIFGGGKD